MGSRLWFLLILNLLIPAGFARAQGSANPTFEVASVKPAETSDLRTSIDIQPNGRFTASATLRALIGFAYDVQDRNISGGPGWMDATAWRIEAKTSGAVLPVTEPVLRQMLRSLLEERFHVAIRHESRDEAVYELLAAKDGAKLKEAASPGTPKLSNGRGRIQAKSVDTGILAKMLSGRLGRAVIDRTGQSGKFDVDLTWVPGASERDDGEIAGALENPDGPTLFTALQEQLGLRLQSGRGPAAFAVIERAEKPDAIEPTSKTRAD